MAQEKLSVRPNYTKVRPGLRGKTRYDIKISDETTIKANSRVIIQPLNPNLPPNTKQLYKLTTYELDNTKKELPESQRDIIRGSSYEIFIENPDRHFRYEEHYDTRSNDQPLFNANNSPSLDDIRQGRIPNCFLLAAIQSILNAPGGADFIKGMMTKEKDGTTTVRLFDPETQEPLFVNVDTAVLVDENWTPLNRHGALWVHVLETAYAALGKRAEGNVDSSSSSVYNDGGSSSTATTILTGLAVEKSLNITKKDNLAVFRIEQHEIDLVNIFRNLPEEEMSQEDKDYRICNILLFKLNDIQLMDKSVARLDNYRDYMNYLDLYTQHKTEIDSVLNSDTSEMTKLTTLLNLPFMYKFNSAFSLFNKVYNYLGVPTNDNTVRGHTSITHTGYYTPQQHNIYQELEEAQKKHQLITCSTPDKFKNSEPGLRANHAYTVLEVYTRDNNAYVKLRNPWGEVGRVYSQKEGRAGVQAEEEVNAGVFELELADFCNNFTHISISAPAEKLLQYNQQERALRRAIESIKADFINPRKITVNNFIELKRRYDDYTQNLLALENLHLHGLPEQKLKDIQAIAKTVFEDKGISEADRKDQLFAKMATSHLHPSFYTASDDKKYLHLYNLLKLEWLKNKHPLDNNAIKKVEADIINNANYEFCSVLNPVKSQLDRFIKDFEHGIILNFIEIEKLIHQIEEKAKVVTTETMTDLIALVEKLNTLQITTAGQIAALRKLGINFDEQLNKICIAISKIESSLAQFPHFESLKKRYEEQKIKTKDAVIEAHVGEGLSNEKAMLLEEILNQSALGQEDVERLKVELKILKETTERCPENMGLVKHLQAFIDCANAILDWINNQVCKLIASISKPEQGYFIGDNDKTKHESLDDDDFKVKFRSN